jgi:hypothetical protein
MASTNPNYTVTIMTVNPAEGTPVVVNAYMPQQFTFDSQSEYQAPFSQGVFGENALTSLARMGGIRLTSQALTAKIWQGSTDTQLGLELEFQTETDPVKDVRDPILKLLKLTTPRMDVKSGMLQSPGPQLDIQAAKDILSAAKDQFVDTASYAGTALGEAFGLIKPAKMTNSETQVLNGNNQTQGVPSNGGLGQAEEWKRRIKNQISISIGRYAFFDSVVITNVQKTYESQIDARTGLPMYARVAVQFTPLFLLLQSDLDKIFALQGAQ